MMQPALPDQRLTVADFLAFQGEADHRYELIDGQIVAMNPPISRHGTIVINAAVVIERELERRPPCRAVAEAGIRIADENYYVADLAVTCSDDQATNDTRDPLLVVEVSSPSTRDLDSGRKLRDYKELPSVVEVWLIDGERRRVQVWRRDDEGWSARDHVGKGRFASGMLAADVALDRLYRFTGL